MPGMPGMAPPPPPQGGRTGRTIALVVGALVLVGAIIVGVVMFTGGGGSDIADDGPHKLITPSTVADVYHQTGTSDDSLSDSDVEDFENYGVHDPKAVGGTYATDDEQLKKKQLQFSGVWGRIDDPEAVVDAAFKKISDAAAQDSGTGSAGKPELVGSPETKTPAGFTDAVMKCQAAKFTPPASSDVPVDSVSVPICMWADHSTVGWVISAGPAAILSGGLSLDDAAALTAKVRSDVRVTA
jgi:hypothetical protein